MYIKTEGDWAVFTSEKEPGGKELDRVPLRPADRVGYETRLIETASGVEWVHVKMPGPVELLSQRFTELEKTVLSLRQQMTTLSATVKEVSK